MGGTVVSARPKSDGRASDGAREPEWKWIPPVSRHIHPAEIENRLRLEKEPGVLSEAEWGISADGPAAAWQEMRMRASAVERPRAKVETGCAFMWENRMTESWRAAEWLRRSGGMGYGASNRTR